MTKQNEIQIAVQAQALEPDSAKTVTTGFMRFWDSITEWEDKAYALVVTDENQKELMKQASDARKMLKAIRLDADKTRKALKEDSMRYANAVQKCYNIIESKIKPMEEHLEKQEKFAEIAAERRAVEIGEQRIKEATEKNLLPYMTNVSAYAWGTLTEAEWDDQLNYAVFKKQQADKLEQERKEQEKAEQERREKERADALEKMQQEKERLEEQLKNAQKEQKKNDVAGTISSVKTELSSSDKQEILKVVKNSAAFRTGLKKSYDSIEDKKIKDALVRLGKQLQQIEKELEELSNGK